MPCRSVVIVILLDIMADKKKKRDLVSDEEQVGREEADRQMDRFFKELRDHLKDVPEEDIKAGAERMMDFIKGKLSWADLFDFSPEMLFQMAEYGLTQFKVGRYQDAERVFKVLTILDWDNAYYHSVMGSILQRQRRFGEALAEYTQAIELDPADIVSHTNRGEIFLQHGLLEEAEGDFTRAIELDPDEEDRFANRARMLMEQMEKFKEGDKKGRGH